MTLKLKYQNEFNKSYLIDELSEEQQNEYNKFMNKVSSKLRLSKKQNQQVIADFNNALIYYTKNGLSLEKALKRLDPDKLGDFYLEAGNNWYPLDNAATIYPLSMKFGQMPMFRVSAYLTESVVPEILQMALSFTIKRFPSFATTIKAGFFWHYLDSTRMRYQIENERILPCIPINVSGLRAQSFRVLYYKKRISIELFHVLTDGSGAMVFLKSLVAEYLRLMGHKVSSDDGCWDINEESSADEVSNEFAKAELRSGVSGFTGKRAVQMDGKISNIKPCRVLHFEMDGEKLHSVAKKHNVTITNYVLGQMFLAVKAASKTKGEVRIQVPINMRKFNGSKTVRNYAMYFDCDLNIDEIGSLEEILPLIKKQIQEKSSEEEMNRMMSTTIKLVKSLKFVPLGIKKPVASLAYGFLGDQIFTTFLSNLGVIDTPKEMQKLVEKFDFVLGPSDLCRASCGLITYNQKTVLSITKITANSSFEDNLLALFEKDGIAVEVSGSGLYED